MQISVSRCSYIPNHDLQKLTVTIFVISLEFPGIICDSSRTHTYLSHPKSSKSSEVFIPKLKYHAMKDAPWCLVQFCQKEGKSSAVFPSKSKKIRNFYKNTCSNQEGPFSVEVPQVGSEQVHYSCNKIRKTHNSLLIIICQNFVVLQL